MENNSSSKVTSTSLAEHYQWGTGCDGWHLAKTRGLSVIQERVPQGGAEVRHYHRQAEQFFYVLSGIASIEIDGDMHHLKPEQGIHVPAGVPHQLMNQHAVELSFLVISSPPSHSDRIEQDHP